MNQRRPNRAVIAGAGLLIVILAATWGGDAKPAKAPAKQVAANLSDYLARSPGERPMVTLSSKGKSWEIECAKCGALSEPLTDAQMAGDAAELAVQDVLGAGSVLDLGVGEAQPIVGLLLIDALPSFGGAGNGQAILDGSRGGGGFYGGGIVVLPPGVSVPPVSAVPEPATWLAMLLGFGVIGYALRRKEGVRT